MVFCLSRLKRGLEDSCLLKINFAPNDYQFLIYNKSNAAYLVQNFERISMVLKPAAQLLSVKSYGRKKKS